MPVHTADQGGHVLRIDHVGRRPAFRCARRPRLVLLYQAKALSAKLRGPLVLVALRVGLLLVSGLPDATLQVLECLGHDLAVDAHLAGRLVDQVHSLVRQKAVGNVAPTQAYSRLDRAFGHSDLVVRLVPGPQRPQHLDSRFDVRLLYQHRLEPALESGVLLYVSVVLPFCGGPQHLYLAPGEGRLHHVAGVDGPFGRPRAHDGVKFVYERDDLAVRLPDLVEDGFKALLELPAELAPGNHPRNVQGD